MCARHEDQSPWSDLISISSPNCICVPKAGTQSVALSQQNFIFYSSTKYTVRRPTVGWCWCLNSPVLFGVAVLVAILGRLVLVPFLQIGPIHGARHGHGQVFPWVVAGHACLPSCKYACRQNCVSTWPQGPALPILTDVAAFSGGGPERAGPFSHRFLLPP